MYWFFKFDIFSICLLVFFNFGSNSCSVILKYQELFFHCCVPPCVNGFLLCVYLHACVCVCRAAAVRRRPSRRAGCRPPPSPSSASCPPSQYRLAHISSKECPSTSQRLKTSNWKRYGPRLNWPASYYFHWLPTSLSQKLEIALSGEKKKKKKD